MKKLLSLISTLVIGASLAVGVGSAAYNKKSIQANAVATEEFDFTNVSWNASDKSSIGNTGWVNDNSETFSKDGSGRGISYSKIETSISYTLTSYGVSSVSVTVSANNAGYTLYLENGTTKSTGQTVSKSNKTVYTFSTPTFIKGDTVRISWTKTSEVKSIMIAGVSLTKVVSTTVNVTGVSLDKTSETIFVGQTLTLNETVSPSDATDKSVSWSSSNTDVATVDDGIVTAIATGTSTITVTTTDQNKTASCLITVSTYSYASYSKITSMEQFFIGQQIVIANASGSMMVSSTQNTSNRSAVGCTVTNNELTPSSGDFSIFTVGIYEITTSDNENGLITYSFYDANENSKGYLYASSSSSNQLKTQKTLNNNGNFSISFDDDGNTIIVAQGSNSRNSLRYNPNNGSPIFSCYASTSTLEQTSLYSSSVATSEQLAATFEVKYMHMVSADTSSTGTGLCSSDGWYSAAKTAYNALDDETISVFSEYHVAAYNRLLAWATANGDQLDGDMRLVSMRITSQLNSFEFNSNSSITFIVLAVICGCATFGFVSLTKKRKHN